MAMEDFNKKKAALESDLEDANMSFDGERIGKAEKALAELEASKSSYEDKAEHVGEVTESQQTRITESGGDLNVLKEKTGEVDAKIESVKSETKKEVEEKSVIGENYPVSFDYVGKHFETDEADTKDTAFNKGNLDYEITGKVMRMSSPDATKDGVLTVPVKYNIYRGVNGDKTPIFKNTGEEGYDFEKPQVVERKVFFEPDTKELYYIDPTLGKKSIESSQMVKMMEEASSVLKTEK